MHTGDKDTFYTHTSAQEEMQFDTLLTSPMRYRYTNFLLVLAKTTFSGL